LSPEQTDKTCSFSEFITNIILKPEVNTAIIDIQKSIQNLKPFQHFENTAPSPWPHLCTIKMILEESSRMAHISKVNRLVPDAPGSSRSCGD
jgi:hypothetical protein